MCERYYNQKQNRLNPSYKLTSNTRKRLWHAFKGKNKSSSTEDFLGINVVIYEKWIEFQMTPEMNRLIIETDHVKPICLFDVSKHFELRDAFK